MISDLVKQITLVDNIDPAVGDMTKRAAYKYFDLQKIFLFTTITLATVIIIISGGSICLYRKFNLMQSRFASNYQVETENEGANTASSDDATANETETVTRILPSREDESRFEHIPLRDLQSNTTNIPRNASFYVPDEFFLRDFNERETGARKKIPYNSTHSSSTRGSQEGNVSLQHENMREEARFSKDYAYATMKRNRVANWRERDANYEPYKPYSDTTVLSTTSTQVVPSYQAPKPYPGTAVLPVTTSTQVVLPKDTNKQDKK